MVRAGLAGALALLAAAVSADEAGPGLRPVELAAVPGWRADDAALAFRVFRAGCAGAGERAPTSLPPPPGLAAICREALSGPSDPATGEAARFFETRFTAYGPADPDATGLLTGYFEPEIEGSLVRDPAFPAPLLARPAVAPSPFPDRAAIEDGALGEAARPLVHLRDPVDAFMVHVQGSTRIRLPDGRVARAAFDGRNGHPYTSIGRLLAERLGVPPAEMPADRLYGWLREHPGEGRELMRRNRSFIFFRLDPSLAPDQGPRGAAGVPLTPGRSLAADRAVWPYGLPAWLAGAEPGGMPGRLVVIQDTGAAITGPLRGDLFLGTGAEAGRLAGRLRERVRPLVLWPKDDPPPSLVRP